MDDGSIFQLNCHRLVGAFHEESDELHVGDLGRIMRFKMLVEYVGGGGEVGV